MGRRRAAAGAARAGDDVVVIRETAALKAFADPMRHQLLSLLDKPTSVRELAAALEKPPDRLYYHLNVLERFGLVRALVERGAERRYVVAARSFRVDPALTVPAADVERLLRRILDTVQREYAAAKRERDGNRRKMLALKHVRLTEDQRADLMRRLESIADEAEEAGPEASADAGNPSDTSTGGTRTYGVLTGLWPVEEERR
ncbi:MAG TPA: winged helix-turn-helix domain-containing protein [Acidimicrobiales bacterium]